jgi:putative addiction module component (TIGR02574 family)
MTVDINKLLSLPQKERRKIAEKLWDSLSPSKSTITLSKEEKKLLESRWSKYVSRKMKFYSSSEMQKMAFGKEKS